MDEIPTDLELRLAALEAQLRIQAAAVPVRSYLLAFTDINEFSKKLLEHTTKGHRVRGNINIDTHPTSGVVMRAWCLMDVYE